jgi:integrase
MACRHAGCAGVSNDEAASVTEQATLVPASTSADEQATWRWPLDAARYDRAPALTLDEAAALTTLAPHLHAWRLGRESEWEVIERLVRPLADARGVLEIRSQREAGIADRAVAELLVETLERRSSIWSWSPAIWGDVLGRDRRSFLAARPAWARGDLRQHMAAIAYLLQCFTELQRLGRFERGALARKVFGSRQVGAAVAPVEQVLAGWGYANRCSGRGIRRVVCEALLLNGSPRLEDLTIEILVRLRQGASRGTCATIHQLERALATLDITAAPEPPALPQPVTGEVDPRWTEWVLRWEATSTLMPSTRTDARSVLLKLGRWLAAEHPEVSEPGQWTRQLCAMAVATIDRMRVGDYVARRDALEPERIGMPLSARSKDNYLGMLRQFFRDCAEWGWIPRRFDPGRSLATPRSVKALIGPSPRVIADELWAKLLWAGLNLNAKDLPAGKQYPLEMVRALSLTWLFSGLRGNEIVRLRLGCVRWQVQQGDRDEQAVCMLDVPAHKTGTAFTKPVDPLLGRALVSWEAVRPAQPHLLDRRTGELVAFLFCYRAKRVATQYINEGVIPALCRKAGIPRSDARGPITSHRARSTIATHLFNAKDPMSLFELQAWLGHRSPASTQNYAAITPTTLARAYTDAGYFARNLRTISVLVDRDAVVSGAAARGEPWQFFDLGHGHCTYTFFEQCQHRMACARCDFYVPKESTRGQLLEARANLERMMVQIPLTDDERAAVEDGQLALDGLLERLADVPTPAGPTPRQLGLRPLPVINAKARPGGGSVR